MKLIIPIPLIENTENFKGRMTMLDILPWSFDHRTTSSYQEFSSASEKSPICLEVRGWQIAPFICHMRITQTWHSLTNPRYVMITSKPAKASVEKYKFALVADNFLWHYHSVLSHQEKVRYVQLVQYVSWRMASADKPERFNSPTEGSLAGLPVGITYDCAFIHVLFWPDSQNKAWPNKNNQPLNYRFLTMPKTKLQVWSNVPSLKCFMVNETIVIF